MSKKRRDPMCLQVSGQGSTFYDDMITCSTAPGKTVCKVVWNMGAEDEETYNIFHIAIDKAALLVL